MSMSQKLSGFAKTFRSALLTRWQGFSDSDVEYDLSYHVDLERDRKSKGGCRCCPYLPPICAQKWPRAEQWIWVTVNNPPDHKGILSRSILHLLVVTFRIVEPTIFVAQFVFCSSLSSLNTLISPFCYQCHLLCFQEIAWLFVCLFCFILTAAPLRACAAGSRLWQRLMLASM